MTILFFIIIVVAVLVAVIAPISAVQRLRNQTEESEHKQMLWIQKYYIPHIILIVFGIGNLVYGISHYTQTNDAIFATYLGAVLIIAAFIGFFTRKRIIQQQTAALLRPNPAHFSIQKNTSIWILVGLFIAVGVYNLFGLTFFQGLLLALVAVAIPYVYYFYKMKHLPISSTVVENQAQNSEPPNSTQNTSQKNTEHPYLIPFSIALAGLIIGGAIVFVQIYLSNKTVAGQNAALGAGTNGTAAAPIVNIKNVNTTGEPFIGNANAPVTIAYWSDYQCPFCKQFEVSTLPDLITNYVNKGELKVVFKDFPFLGPDSTADGEYARAVWILYPNQFFAWRTAMFSTQPEENSLSTTANQARLTSLTATIPGIDPSKVLAYVIANQATLDKEINADMQEGEADGIQGTPSFIVGTQLLVGAEPVTAFAQAIEAQLPAGK